MLRLREARVWEISSACMTSQTQHSRSTSKLRMRNLVSSDSALKTLANCLILFPSNIMHYCAYVIMLLYYYSDVKFTGFLASILTALNMYRCRDFTGKLVCVVKLQTTGLIRC